MEKLVSNVIEEWIDPMGPYLVRHRVWADGRQTFRILSAQPRQDNEVEPLGDGNARARVLPCA